ncbi:hypothetical protein [Nostoc flagelliforme]|uniref:hypothetical protein n=1 Tax=Nostoc flagelliforme TaxID=1306274 RepID=UPI0012FD43C3|nr:hypothetical protein [Nostoc flagelliforme]
MLLRCNNYKLSWNKLWCDRTGVSGSKIQRLSPIWREVNFPIRHYFGSFRLRSRRVAQYKSLLPFGYALLLSETLRERLRSGQAHGKPTPHFLRLCDRIYQWES